MVMEKEFEETLRKVVQENPSSGMVVSEEATLPRHMFDAEDVIDRVNGADVLRCKARFWGYLRHFSNGSPKVWFNPDKLEWELDSKETRKFRLKRVGTGIDDDGVKIYHYYIIICED